MAMKKCFPRPHDLILSVHRQVKMLIDRKDAQFANLAGLEHISMVKKYVAE